jgi:phage antirepressor YoqD-like protein
VIYEDGIWELIFRSSLPGAKAIKARVKAILKQIRETGRYEVTAELAKPTNRELALMVIEEADRADREMIRADAAEGRVTELEPKAAAHDAYLTAQASERLVRQVAKLLGWSEKQLRLFLVEEKFIFHRQAPCGQSQWDHYADHAAHFHPVEKIVEHSWGHCSHYTLYLTSAGIDAVQRRVAKRQAQMRAAIESAPVA